MWLTCVISRLVRENQGNCYQNNYIQGHQNNDLGAPRDLETFLALPLMPSGMWPSQIISLCLRPFLFGYQKYTYLIKWSKKLFYFCLHWKSLSSTGNKFEDLVKLTFGLKWIWSYYPWEKAYSWWIFDLDNSAFGLDPEYCTHMGEVEGRRRKINMKACYVPCFKAYHTILQSCKGRKTEI